MAKLLTEEDILNANSYLPIADKQSMATAYARDCIDRIKLFREKDEFETKLPPMYQESSIKRMMYGMLVLLRDYLKQDDIEDITTDVYDDWGKVAVFNQLDRFKASKNIEVRNKAYDIVDDYREFYRMLGAEINVIVQAKNDVVSRTAQLLITSSDPEEIKETMKEIVEYAKKLPEEKIEG